MYNILIIACFKEDCIMEAGGYKVMHFAGWPDYV
jgi:hypothetical protein